MKAQIKCFARLFQPLVFSVILVCLLVLNKVQAQRPSPSFGIGVHVGEPTGLSLQFYRNTGVSADVLLAYDFDDYFFMNVHGLWNTHLDNAGHFHFYYGPGGYVRIRDYKTGDQRDQVAAGISGNFGLGLVISRFEIFGQITPRLDLTPFTEFEFGGGVGARFFF